MEQGEQKKCMLSRSGVLGVITRLCAVDTTYRLNRYMFSHMYATGFSNVYGSCSVVM